MLRSFLLLSGILLTVATALSVGLHQSGRVDLYSLFTPLPELDSTFQRGFRSDALLEINRQRVPLGVVTANVDEEIQQFIKNYVASRSDPDEIDLDDVFDSLQKEFPGAQYLAANLVTAKSRSELLETLNRWDAIVNPDFRSITVGVFASGGRLGALGVMSQRIPRFTLAAANRHNGKFFNQCPHCQKIHALEIDRKSRTLILSCPDCKRPFDVLAADTRGKIRRANDFMTGFSLPKKHNTEASHSPEEKILAIWQRIANQCRYESDQSRNDSREAWKFPKETWLEKAGDCEDTAILLADSLISAGFDARVAIGWNGNIGQHAWCVVRAGGSQYVLESTFEGVLNHKSLVNVSEAAPFYQPEQLFDRENLYFIAGKPDVAGNDYFAASAWNKLKVEGNLTAPKTAMVRLPRLK